MKVKTAQEVLRAAVSPFHFLYETRIKISGKWLTGRICVTSVRQTE